MADIVVVGGGVIGLSVAYQMAGQGAGVTVLDQSLFGQEASWAGAGMLPPGNFEAAPDGEPKLRGLSAGLWSEWSKQLLDQTGIDNGYRMTGGLHVSFSPKPNVFDTQIANWRAENVAVEPLTPTATRAQDPLISSAITRAFLLPNQSQVRNPRHLKALICACEMRGVKLKSGSPVIGWKTSGDRVIAARTMSDEIHGDTFVITAGAWSQQLLPSPCVAPKIRPIRGQIVLLNTRSAKPRHIVESGVRYLVPRSDGRILVGSTEEDVGFEKRNTADGVRGLIEFAEKLIPALKDATLERCWSGLRPKTNDSLPYIGRIPNLDNLILASGHYRAGLQLSPGTALIVSQLITHSPLACSIDAFSIERDTVANETVINNL